MSALIPVPEEQVPCRHAERRRIWGEEKHCARTFVTAEPAERDCCRWLRGSKGGVSARLSALTPAGWDAESCRRTEAPPQGQSSPWCCLMWRIPARNDLIPRFIRPNNDGCRKPQQGRPASPAVRKDNVFGCLINPAALIPLPGLETEEIPPLIIHPLCSPLRGVVE